MVLFGWDHANQNMWVQRIFFLVDARVIIGGRRNLVAKTADTKDKRLGRKSLYGIRQPHATFGKS